MYLICCDVFSFQSYAKFSFYNLFHYFVNVIQAQEAFSYRVVALILSSVCSTKKFMKNRVFVLHTMFFECGDKV